METTSTRNSSSSSSRFARAACIAVVCLMLLGHFAAGPSLQQRVKRALFGADESGGMYLVHPKYVRANADGTGAVAVGEAFGWVQDLSGNGLHLKQATATARPVLKLESAGVYYGDLDGVDDFLSSDAGYTVELGSYLAAATRQSTAPGGVTQFGAGINSQNRHTMLLASGRAHLRFPGGIFTVGEIESVSKAVCDSLVLEGQVDVSLDGAPPTVLADAAITGLSIPSSTISTNTFGTITPHHFFGGIAHAGDPGPHRTLVVDWLKQISGVA